MPSTTWNRSSTLPKTPIADQCRRQMPIGGMPTTRQLEVNATASGGIYVPGSFNLMRSALQARRQDRLNGILQEAWPRRPRCKFNEIGRLSLRDTGESRSRNAIRPTPAQNTNKKT